MCLRPNHFQSKSAAEDTEGEEENTELAKEAEDTEGALQEINDSLSKSAVSIITSCFSIKILTTDTLLIYGFSL